MVGLPDDSEVDDDVLGIGWAAVLTVAFFLFMSIFGQCSVGCEVRSAPVGDHVLPPLGD